MNAASILLYSGRPAGGLLLRCSHPSRAQEGNICQGDHRGTVLSQGELYSCGGVVENKGTMDAIHSTSVVKDRKLCRDIVAIKQMMKLNQIKSEVVFGAGTAGELHDPEEGTLCGL